MQAVKEFWLGLVYMRMYSSQSTCVEVDWHMWIEVDTHASNNALGRKEHTHVPSEGWLAPADDPI
jgi:hypothetical protein